MVKARVKGWGMHYVCESPYKSTSTRMCVHVLVLGTN